MNRGKITLLVSVASLAIAMLVGQAMSQDSQPASQPRGGFGRPGGGGWGGDPEQMKKAMEAWKKQAAQAMKESLGSTDEEWAVLEPKIEKVATLSAQTKGGMVMGGMIMIGLGGSADNQPEVVKKAQSLREVLKNKDAKAADIAAALKEYRDAQAKVKEELTKAQKDLKELLTPKQEAQLVSMGILD